MVLRLKTLVNTKSFDNKQDVDRILMRELGSFDKHLVVMQRYEKNTLIHELQFDRASFWV